MGKETELQLVVQLLNQTTSDFATLNKDIKRTNREVRNSSKLWQKNGSCIKENLESIANQSGLTIGPIGMLLNTLKSFGPAAAGMAAAAAGVLAFAKAVNDGTMHAAEWDRQMGRTNALLRSTGFAAGLTSAEIEEMAKSFDRVTLGSKDNILDAINALQTFKTVSGDNFERAISLSLDLSEILGTSAKSGALQLGKALEDPVRQLSYLRRSGISFTSEQEDMIKALAESGNMLAAQSEILSVIEDQLGGTAAGAGEAGLLGKVDRLGYEWREFLESLEQTALYVGAVEMLTGAVQKLREVVGERSPEERLEDIEKAIAIKKRELRKAQATVPFGVEGDASDLGLKFGNAELEVLEKKKAAIEEEIKARAELDRRDRNKAERAAADVRGEQLLAAKRRGEAENAKKAEKEAEQAQKKAEREAVNSAKKVASERASVERWASGVRLNLMRDEHERRKAVILAEAELQRHKAHGDPALLQEIDSATTGKLARVEEDRLKAKKTSMEKYRLFMMSENEREVAELWVKYQEMLELADKYGMARSEVLAKYHEENQGLLAEHDREALDSSKAASAGMIRALRDYADEAADAGSQIQTAMTGWIDAADDKFTMMAQGMKVEWDDLAQTMYADILRMQFRTNVSGPISEGLNSIMASLFHGGGEVGKGGGQSRAVSPLTFANAPRFHSGLLPNEFPAILERGETVYTERQNRGLIGLLAAAGSRSGGDMYVNINNNAGAEVGVESHEDADGNTNLELTIDRAVARSLNRPGSESRRAVQQAGRNVAVRR